MTERNYKSIVTSLIPSCSIRKLREGSYAICYDIRDLDAEDNTIIIKTFCRITIGVGDSEFSAWKEAYYNLSNKKLEEITK